MIGGMIGHEARDGHAERDEAIEKRVRAECAADVVALKNELETEHMRLAACGVAALGYFDGCKDEYRSASLDDTLRLYKKYEEQATEIEQLELSLEKSLRSGQCWKDNHIAGNVVIAEQAALIEQYQILIATFFHEYDQEVPHHGLLADALHNLRMFEPAVEEWRKK